MPECIAIILGASAWPRSQRLASSATFKNSAVELRRYLLSPEGLAIDKKDLLDLFDDPRSVDDVDQAIADFLTDVKIRHGREPKNLLIYYTGHGAFVEGDNKYCLTLRNSRLDSLSTSAYRMSSLARRLNREIPNARRYVILDACFAAAALPDFIPQSDVASRMQNETLDALAESGTALLCAASSADVALAPRSDKYTMFSGAILRALLFGSNEYGPTLTFEDLAGLSEKFVKEKFRDEAVKPEVHIPDQRRGSIARIGLFPNAAPKNAVPNEQQPQVKISQKPFSWRITGYMTALGAISGALSFFLGMFAPVHIPLGLYVSIAPGYCFGAIVAFGMWLWGTKKPFVSMQVFFLIAVGWAFADYCGQVIWNFLSSYHKVVAEGEKEVTQNFPFVLGVIGLLGGLVWSIFIVTAVSLAIREFRRIEYWVTIILVGATVGISLAAAQPVFLV